MKIKKIKNLDLFEEKNLNVLLRTFLSSFLIISFFFVAPIVINFADKNFRTKEFTNNSKQVLAYTLNDQSINKNLKEIINEDDVLFDIFSLNDLESDTVRLSASTIKQLFEDTGYNLKDVRKKKIS